VAGVEPLIAALHSYDALSVQSERRQARLPGVEHYHQAVALGDAPRRGARVHTLAELDRAVLGNREDAYVLAGSVSHQQVVAVARQSDRTL
jgi:hypothetical protein